MTIAETYLDLILQLLTHDRLVLSSACANLYYTRRRY